MIRADHITGQVTLGGAFTMSRDDPFSHLPTKHDGWVRHDGDTAVLAYWRAKSNHVNGRYERVSVTTTGWNKRSTTRPQFTITKSTFNQFGHQLSGHSGRVSADDPARVWREVRHKMTHSGDGEFESPPALPSAIGDWHLTIEKHEQRADITVWEQDFGRAEIIVEQTDIISQYCNTKHQCRVKYREIDAYPDSVVIVEDIPRTAAFEVAVYIMESLDVPVGDCQARMEALQQIDGIGPAKAESLIMLGIASPAELAEHISNNSPTVNNHHSTAVEKQLTTLIRESV